MIATNLSVGPSPGIWLVDADAASSRSFLEQAGMPDFITADNLIFAARKTIAPYDTARVAVINIVDEYQRRIFAWKIYGPYFFYYNPKVSLKRDRLVASADGYIVSMSMEGDDLRVLTGGWCFYPVWTTDGSQIIYNYDPLGDSYDVRSLWIMNADGSNKHPIPGW